MNSTMNITIRAQARTAQREIKAVETEVRGLTAQLARAKAAMTGLISKQAMTRLSMWGSQMQWAGRQLTANFTMPLALAGGVVTKWVLENETAMTRLQKVYGDSTTGAEDYNRVLGSLNKAFDLLSVRYGQHRSVVADVAAEWAAAGATGAGLARSVDATMQAMVLGEFSAAEATEALIGIQAQYGTDTKGLINIINTLNATENGTGITFRGLVQGMQRSAGAARDAGIDVKHLAAMLAALTPSSGAAATSGNALKTMVSRLLAPTKEAAEVLGLMGIKMDDVNWKSLNAAQRLEVLAKAYNNLEGSSDKMISSQAAVVSAVVASRWQINRFSVLMRDVYNSIDDNAETNGYYGRTLELLADDATVAKVAMRELNTVLESDPMVIKRAGTVIQNSLMKVVAALMPQIMWLANAVATLAKKFSELDPRLQKTILGVLLFFAVLGPPLVLLGSLAVAISRLGLLAGSAVKPFLFLGGIVKASFGGIGKILGAVSSGISGVVGGVSKGIGAAIATASTAAGTAAAASSAAVTAGLAATGPAAATAGAVAGSGYARGFLGAGLVAKLKSGIVAGWTGIIAGVRALGPRLLGVITGPWGIAITAIVTLFFMFRKQIHQVFENIKGQFNDSSSGFGKAWSAVVNLFNKGTSLIKKAFYTLPEGVQNALRAVVNMVRTAAMKVYALFSYINPWARHSPSLVENVTSGMKEVSKQFAEMAAAVRVHSMSAYNSMKVFGNATASFMGKYKKFTQGQDRDLIREVAPGAVKSYNALIAKLGPLERDLAKLEKSITKQEKVVLRYANALKVAQDELTKQEVKLKSLKKVADDLSASLSNAQSELDKYASAPLVGMKAMSDAIFNNEMLQKKLRLELLKLNEVDVGKLEGQLSSLQGEIERLRGTQADLRASGAGADVLGAYQDQINALEAQQDVINNSVGPVNALSDQLAELERQGQILDLENALQFDPLLRQIDDVVNATKELTFEEALTGVTKWKSEVIDLEAKVRAANKEVEKQQKVVDKAAIAVDKATAAYDDQNAKLTTMQGVYDTLKRQIEEIESAIQAVVSAAQDMKSALEAAGGGKGGSLSPGAENFNDAAGGSFSDVGGSSVISDETGDIDAWLEEFQKNTGDIFSKLDVFEPIRKGWTKFKAWWKTNVVPVFDGLGEGLKDIFSNIDFEGKFDWIKNIDLLAPFRAIGDWFSGDSSTAAMFRTWLNEIVAPIKDLWKTLTSDGQLKKWFDDIVEAAKPLWDSIKEFMPVWGEYLKIVAKLLGAVAIILAGALMIALMSIVNLLTNLFLPIWNMVIEVLAAAMKMLSGVLDFVTGVFTGDWEKAWGGIGKIFSGAWDGIFGTVRGILGVMYGILKTAWDNITGVLSIALAGAEGKIKKFKAKVTKWIGDLVSRVKKFFVDLYNNVTGWVSRTVNSVVSWFKSLPGKVRSGIGTLTTVLSKKGEDLVNGLWTGVKNAWTSVKTWFSGLWEKVSTAVGDSFTTLKTKGSDILTGFWNGVTTKWNEVKTWFSGLWNKVSTAIGDVRTKIKNKGSEILGGFQSGVTTKWNEVKSWFGGLGGRVSTSVGDVTTRLKTKGSEILGGFWTGVTTKWSEVRSWFGNLWEKVKNAVGDVTTRLKTKGSEILVGFWTGVTTKWTEVKKWFSDLPGNVVSGIGSVGKTLFNVGKNIVEGLKDGVLSVAGSIGQWIVDKVPGPMKEAVKKALGVKSPSRVFREIGYFMMIGLKNGITDSAGAAIDSAVKVADSLIGVFDSIATSAQISLNASGLSFKSDISTSGNPSAIMATDYDKGALNFYGDLSFPNITDGDDAEEFIENLKVLTGGGGVI